MAIYHDPEDKNKMTFAGGTISQAMAKAKHLKGKESGVNHGEDGGKNSNLGGDNRHAVADHLAKAKEHLEHASEMHTKGTLSSTQQKDPRKVDEEEEAPTMGEPGGEGMRGTGY